MIPTIGVRGSEVTISRLGFGCARILGGDETAATQRLIEAALACGIRHFDTAPSYGEGAAEALLGAVLAGVTDVTVTTKVGIARPAAAAPSFGRRLYRRYLRAPLAAAPRLKQALASVARGRPPAAGPRQRLTPAMIEQSLADSEALLRRRVDLLLIHEPSQLDIDDAVPALLAAMQADGRIGAFGCGADDVVPADLMLGTVRQQRFGGPAGDGATAIFHGVLRGHAGNAAARMTAAMAADPAAAFLFSASTPAQIRELAATVDVAG